MTTPFNLHGQRGAVQMLEAALRDGRLHHAFLLTGPAHVGKLTLAVQFAQVVNCEDGNDACRKRIANGQHSDVRIISVDPEATEGPKTIIGIEAVRDVISSAYLQPYEGKMRVYIINGAGQMSTDAANALLKLLEEPPPGVVLLLLAEHAEEVLPTVRSRCQHLELHPLPIAEAAAVLTDHYAVTPEQADLLSRLSRGCIGWAIEAARDPALLAGVHQRTERIIDVLESTLSDRFGYADELARRYQRDRAAGRDELFLWMRWLRDIMLVQQGNPNAIMHITWRETITRHAAAIPPKHLVRWIQKMMDTLEAMDRNVNARLALESLMLDAPEVPNPAT